MLEGHTRDVSAVAISASDAKIVSGSDDMTIRVWSVESGQVHVCSRCDCLLTFVEWTMPI